MPRLIAAVVALPFTAFAALVAVAAILRGAVDLLQIIIAQTSAFLACILGWFALRGHIARTRTRIGHVLIGAFILGGISFLAGFVGPIIFYPKSNQGPLFGIFITGPVGFTLGGILGAVYSLLRLRGIPSIKSTAGSQRQPD